MNAIFLKKPVHAAPLAVFRIVFGIIMLYSTLRFWANGWIHDFFINPKLYFKFYGFEFVKELGQATYCLFAIKIIACICIVLGYYYRTAMLSFFLCFTYIELIDKTNYLNHYYFISVLSLILCFLPMHVYFSLDANKNRISQSNHVPEWTILSIKVLISIVYIYAGIAKLNSEWLFKAMPLKLWLPLEQDIPLIGHIFSIPWIPYLFSWAGALYDLSIPFLLWNKHLRTYGFILVVIFHILTRILFPIGVFPFIMIGCALIFFSSRFHENLIQWTKKIFNNSKGTLKQISWKPKSIVTPYVIALLLIIQIILPWRYIFYPGPLFWREEGFRFSWRVMLMEKTGIATFKIVDSKTGKFFLVDNTDFLDARQTKQMATQADFIVQYSKMLKDKFYKDGHQNIEIYVENFVSLHGSPSQYMVDPNIDLTKVTDTFSPKTWICPFNYSK